MLNSGFQQGGSVGRLEKDRDGNFREVSFETYAPRAIAGINKLADTLEDRAIVLMMQRKLAREKTERFSRAGLEADAQTLRDRCYRWALTHAQDLHEVYEAADTTFVTMNDLDDRARDLWEPLISIAAVIDTERADPHNSVTTTLVGLAQDLSLVRDGQADTSSTVQVTRALLEIVGHDQVLKIGSTELTDKLKAILGWEKLSPKGTAALLSPIGIVPTLTKQDGKVSRRYHLRSERIADLVERYCPVVEGEA